MRFRFEIGIRYFHENWGALPILGFMTTFIFSALESAMGDSNTSDSFAVLALYFLAVGVILQMASYVKHPQLT